MVLLLAQSSHAGVAVGSWVGSGVLEACNGTMGGETALLSSAVRVLLAQNDGRESAGDHWVDLDVLAQHQRADVG